jgi:hypothetical protein
LCHSSFQMLAHLPANEGIRQCGLAGFLLGSLILASSVPAQAPHLASQWGESAPAAAAHPRPEPHIHHDLRVVARQSLRLDRWTCVQLSVTCGQCNTDDRPVVLDKCLRVLSSRPECCGGELMRWASPDFPQELTVMSGWPPSHAHRVAATVAQ